MEARDVRALVRRDWARLSEDKARFWAARKRTMSPAEALELGDALRRHALLLKPDWPDPTERAAELAVHRRIAEALRACRAIGSR